MNDLVSKNDRGLLSKNKKFVIPNFDEEAEMLEWAGVSFGEEDTYKLGKAIKRLAVMSGAERVRFVAKMYGTNKDYWVCSGVLTGAEEPLAGSDNEVRGTGVNAMVYWVTDNLLSDWIQLPECAPEHIVCSRMIKHVLTGDLNASIDSNPPFPGKERHFLRAMLARIFAATAIVPKGLFEIDEETNEMKYAEEFAMPGTDELKSMETWGNLHPIILKAGRCSHQVPDSIPEDDRDAYMEKLGEDDKTEERFRALNEHVPMPGMETAWISKVVGDAQQYNQLPPKEGTASYAVNVIRSLRWPGALTVAKNGKFTTIYVGYGLKRGDPSYNPTEPPEVCADPEDQVEQPEPTPLEAPKEPAEPDTDAKAKGEEDEDE